MDRLNVSPGRASSQKMGMSWPASKVVLCAWLRSSVLRSVVMRGTWAKRAEADIGEGMRMLGAMG